MRHDITIRSIRTIQEIRFAEQNNGELSITLTFSQDTPLTLSDPNLKPDCVPETRPHVEEEMKKIASALTKLDTIETSLIPTQMQLDAQAALTKVPPTKLIEASQEIIETVIDHVDNTISHTLPLKIEESDNIPCDDKPAKKRRRKPDLSFSLEETESPESTPPIEVVAGSPITSESAPEPNMADWKPSESYQPGDKIGVNNTVETIEATGAVTLIDQPTDEEMKVFRSKLFSFTNDILPKAGLVPTEGIGGISTKIRLYAQKLLGVEPKALTKSQWITFLSNMDVLAVDPINMVSVINKTVGA